MIEKVKKPLSAKELDLIKTMPNKAEPTPDTADVTTPDSPADVFPAKNKSEETMVGETADNPDLSNIQNTPNTPKPDSNLQSEIETFLKKEKIKINNSTPAEVLHSIFLGHLKKAENKTHPLFHSWKALSEQQQAVYYKICGDL